MLLMPMSVALLRHLSVTMSHSILCLIVTRIGEHGKQSIDTNTISDGSGTQNILLKVFSSINEICKGAMKLSLLASSDAFEPIVTDTEYSFWHLAPLSRSFQRPSALQIFIIILLCIILLLFVIFLFLCFLFVVVLLFFFVFILVFFLYVYRCF